MNMEKIEQLRAKFLKVYASLPEPEGYQIVAVIEGKTYSWNKAYAEISDKTALGDKILEKMRLVGII